MRKKRRPARLTKFYLSAFDQKKEGKGEFGRYSAKADNMLSVSFAGSIIPGTLTGKAYFGGCGWLLPWRV